MADAVGELYDPYSGRLTASASMVGFVCRRTGTGTSRSRLGGNTNPSTCLVDVSGMTLPVVAISLDGYGAAFTGRSAPSGSSNFTDINFACAAPVGTAFTYWVFDWTPALPTNSGLFQLFNTSQQCTFSSGYWPMKLITDLGQGESYTASSGTAIAGACSAPGGHSHAQGVYCSDGNSGPKLPEPGELENCRNIVGNIDGKMYGPRSSLGSTKVEAVQVSYDDVFGSFGSYEYYSAYGDGWVVDNRILVIDVTNIPIGVTFF